MQNEETDKLSITLIQSNLFWENKRGNLNQFANRISNLTTKTDIIVLPEMFSTSFTMNAEKLSEPMDGITVTWMKEVANFTGAAVCGSVIIKEGTAVYNRFIWIEPGGYITFYDKAHLFRMGEENKHYDAGKTRTIINYKGWKIAPFVCYDLRFPVWLKRTTSFDYDLMIVVASWPEKRSAHWQVLSQARAIENQCYVAALNRVGEDGNQVTFDGKSALYNPQGKIINQLTSDEFEETYTIHLPELKTYRKAFPVWLDDDDFEIKK
ncbi:MAG: amidohydrolase [Bacteroidota bacterium]